MFPPSHFQFNARQMSGEPNEKAAPNTHHHHQITMRQQQKGQAHNHVSDERDVEDRIEENGADQGHGACAVENGFATMRMIGCDARPKRAV